MTNNFEMNRKVDGHSVASFIASSAFVLTLAAAVMCALMLFSFNSAAVSMIIRNDGVVNMAKVNVMLVAAALFFASLSINADTLRRHLER